MMLIERFSGRLGSFNRLISGIITTRGDLIKGGVGGVAERKAIGAASRFLKSDGVEPQWETISPDFTSTDQTVTFDAILNVAHGLSAVPTFTHVVVKFATAEAGYSISDELPYIYNSTTDANATVAVDATNVTIVQGVFVSVHDQTTFNMVALTAANIRWVVRCWR